MVFVAFIRTGVNKLFLNFKSNNYKLITGTRTQFSLYGGGEKQGEDVFPTNNVSAP